MTETHEYWENILNYIQRFTTTQGFSVTYCCVSVLRVATINDDIPSFKKRNLKKKKKKNWFNKVSLLFFTIDLIQFSTNYQPVYQWSHPQPVQPSPAGWSSWASSAWTPCPPETRLQPPWSPSPHSSGSRAPWTRFGCRRRPVGEVMWLLGEGKRNKFCCQVLRKEIGEGSSYHEAMVIHVHDEVLAHDSQTNQCNVCSVRRKSDNHIYWRALQLVTDWTPTTRTYKTVHYYFHHKTFISFVLHLKEMKAGLKVTQTWHYLWFQS